MERHAENQKNIWHSHFAYVINRAREDSLLRRKFPISFNEIEYQKKCRAIICNLGIIIGFGFTAIFLYFTHFYINFSNIYEFEVYEIRTCYLKKSFYL